MKNRITGFLLTLLFVFILCVACGDKDKMYTVTFVQDGQEEIVKTVKSGETLSDIPSPQEVEGYEVRWDRNTFSDVDGDLRVTAILTPKTYTITYSYDPLLLNGGYTVVLEKETQAVTFHSDYVLATASCEGLVFLGWKDAENNQTVLSGKYMQPKNMTLIAQFEPEEKEWS